MKNNIFLILSMMLGVFSMTSCLKDDVGEDWTDAIAGKMYAQISSPGFQAKSILPVADDITFKFLVNIATDALPTKDITLTLAFDNAAIMAYDSTTRAIAIANNDTLVGGKLNWRDYKPFPSMELLDQTVIISAGSRSAYVRVKVSRADTVQISGNYMAAISIASVSDGIKIASNMKTVLFGLPLANQYEGDYLSEGFRDHPDAGIQPYKYPKLAMTTVNANTVHKEQVGNYSGYGLDITITDQTMVVAGVTVYKCVLQITGMASATDMGVYDTFNGEPMNYYNPITKVFELYYYYNKGAPRKLRETDSRI